MITTVTLNPAVDKTIEVDNFDVGIVNRIGASRIDAGGKGINVSKVIKALGGRSKAVGILSGTNGNFIKKYLDEEDIENDFVFVKGNTRTNIKVVDKVKHTNTDINENGPKVCKKDVDDVCLKFCKEINHDSIIVFSGSVPNGADMDVYKSYIEIASEKGARTIFDADGQLLKLGLDSGPFLVKPNIYELESIFGQKIENKEQAVKLSRKLFDYGVKNVVVSLGGEGALFIKKNVVVFAHGIKVNVGSTVGAGDSMVAALALAIDKNYDFEKAIRLAVACGTASVTMSGTQTASIDVISGFEKQVNIEYLNY
ncbi:1-phosphofructokinase [Clostridium ljungdahlii]|uniref:Tagatose-6-phosphate kinase n=1 Tax=Clostridium ljungdahlii TaxID=1538 RepID=A0A166SJM2_9CLOT|nr:1-phosphofructokinase [Clostridium ljungdahlii]OAA92401.1 Tagatose-6-phosphate kinase [Clostridium ljungdahlii]